MSKGHKERDKLPLNPEERRVQYNRNRIVSLENYVDAENLFQKMKYKDKIWIGDNLVNLRLLGYQVIGKEKVDIPARHVDVIAAIGPKCTRLILASQEKNNPVIKDVMSYNIIDGLFYVSLKKLH